MRRRFSLVFQVLVVLMFSAAVYHGCYYRSSSRIVLRIKGSDTMLNLTMLLANKFMKENPGVSIYVEGGGTKTGIDALVTGQIDICTASRLLKSDEIKKMADAFNSIGVSTYVAKDALSIYLNPKNPVKNLSLELVRNIFTCRINNWKYLGGEDKSIRVISRSPNSGTYLYFKEHVLESDEYCADAIIKSTTEEIVDEVTNDNTAIGYGGVGYGKNIFHASVNGIKPTEENVRNGSYPVSRYLFFVTRNNPQDLTKTFIDWVISSEGQNTIKQAGYIAIWESKK